MSVLNITKEDVAIMKMFISVFDYDYNSNDLIGKVEINLAEVMN